MRFIDAIVRLVPFKHKLCTWGALWPVRYRHPLITRIFAKFARSLGETNPQLQLVSKLGIDDSLRVSLPIRAQWNYLFGRPQDYRGERCVLFLVRHLAKRCDAIADIGANWGYHAYYFAVHAPTTPIYSFEANKALSVHVQANVSGNRLNNVHCINKAIAAHSGEVVFYLNSTDDLSSSLTEVFAENGHTVQKTTVLAQSFDDFASSHHHTQWLLKVDVESAEFLFLEGARQSIARGQIPYLIIELLTLARSGGFVARLIELGFHAYYLNDLQVEHVVHDDGRSAPGEYNWLFCKESPSELTERLRGTAFQVRT